MDRAQVSPGWPADTTRPLGAIPFVFGAICAAVLAMVFDNAPVVQAVAWLVFGALVLVLGLRGIRWISRQLEAAQFEHQMDEILERQPRLVPVFRPRRHWDQLNHTDYHKAS